MNEKITEPSDLRLLCAVFQPGYPAGRYCRHNHIFCCSHAGIIQFQRSSAQPAGNGGKSCSVILTVSAQPGKSLHMQVDRPVPDHAAARMAEGYLPEPAQERAHQHDGGTHPGHILLRQAAVRKLRRIDPDFPSFPVHPASDACKDPAHVFHIRYAGTVPEYTHSRYQKGRCHNRQSRILGALDRHFTVQRRVSADINRLQMSTFPVFFKIELFYPMPGRDRRCLTAAARSCPSASARSHTASAAPPRNHTDLSRIPLATLSTRPISMSRNMTDEPP